jgi:hypothetical protein
MMLDHTKLERWADQDVRESYINELLSAILDGLTEARAAAAGGGMNVQTIERYADALDALRTGTVHGKLHFTWVVPTEADVAAARHLAQVGRQGASREALMEAGERAARVMTDSYDLERLHSALLCLQDETFRAQHRVGIQEALRRALTIFERGCHVAGFVSTAVDADNVRRLRHFSATEGPEALVECLRLAKEMEARLPPHSMLNVTERQDIPELLYLER